MNRHSRYRVGHERTFGGEGRCSARWIDGRCEKPAGHDGLHAHREGDTVYEWSNDGSGVELKAFTHWFRFQA